MPHLRGAVPFSEDKDMHRIRSDGLPSLRTLLHAVQKAFFKKIFDRREVFFLPYKEGKQKCLPKEPCALKHGASRGGPVYQEIIIRGDGKVVIPWVAPQASNLVVDLWRQFYGSSPFPVRALTNHIYCG